MAPAIALRFEHAACAAFDLFLLQREGAEADYSPDDRDAAQAWMDASDTATRAALLRTITAGLPGAEEHYTIDTFRTRNAAYDGMDHADLRAQLAGFLDIVLPVAEQEGARLAIHPDDPPRDLFGLPRIVSTQADLTWIAAWSASAAHGFTLCTGSLGARPDNDLMAIISSLGDRIHFAHLRAVKRQRDPRDFFEDNHLEGDLDMVAIVRALLALERRTGVQIPMRPDHGHRILHDLTQETTPGYPAIGRLRGLAELRGVAAALSADDSHMKFRS